MTLSTKIRKLSFHSEDGEGSDDLNNKLEKESNQQLEIRLSSYLDEHQLANSESCQQLTFPDSTIREIIHSITGNHVTPKVVYVIGKIAKLFAQDVIETAMTIKDKSGDSGPLESKHIREAVRKVQSKKS